MIRDGLKRSVTLAVFFWLVVSAGISLAQSREPVELARSKEEYSKASLSTAQMDGQLGIAVKFEGTGDLHYYALPETASAPGMELRIRGQSNDVELGKAVFPEWKIFNDPFLKKQVEVYAGDFTVFIPVVTAKEKIPEQADVTVVVSGQTCTSKVCLFPFETELKGKFNLADKVTETVSFAEAQKPDTKAVVKSGGSTVMDVSLPVALGLAVLAGISINIMPCVLPVIPLILMRLIQNSKESSGKRIVSGMSFCIGVILFFAVFAALSAVVYFTTGSFININDLFREPVAAIVLFLVILFFALVMLDVIALVLPSSIMSKQGSGLGVVGSLGMGFFAGILSTPCSGALLGAVLVWAQTQPILISSIAIITMGVGMALPYAVIILIPSLLNKIPKPGTWMEIFKKTCGFLLIFIAAKLTLATLEKEWLLNVLSYGIIFSFCVWMWGKWVSFSAPAGKKWSVRLMALLIAAGAGFWLLPEPVQYIAWKPYDRAVVETAKKNQEPVVIKFTADWCTNCKVVDKRVFKDMEVVELVERKGVYAIKADTTTKKYAAYTDLDEIYGQAGNIPYTVVILPDGSQKELLGIYNKKELMEILKTIPDAEEREEDGSEEKAR